MKRKKCVVPILMVLMLLASVPVMNVLDIPIPKVWGAATIKGEWIEADDGRWWYRHTDGTYTTNNWEFINGKWYYFDAAGWMCYDWICILDKWYYLGGSDDGAMKMGWINDDGRLYYLSPEKTVTYTQGQMVTGWHKIGENWYYFSEEPTGEYKLGHRRW